ncbi:hypothetical protein Tco_0754023 [Tanacetum coccineum]
MVAFLDKPTESAGFEEIVDFLNAHQIRYALTVNPTIYVSCIEQFWSTAKAKTINEETQIHALVDGKKIVITESSVRRDLQLADENGIDCLLNTTIFENLALMGLKTTVWNEFSSVMASAIICLATNQTFNFSKLIFDSMMKNLDGSNKFLMYPRFVQVFLDKQLDKVPSHNAIFSAPCHTKKVFANMKRIGKVFSRKVTPLFDTMLIQHQADVGEVDEAVLKERGDSLERAATTASILKAKQVSGSGPRRQDTMGDTIAQTRFENVSKTSYDPLLARGNTLRSCEDSMQLKKLMEICTKLQQRVLDLENSKTSQAQEITRLKLRVKKLEKKGGSRTHKLKRLYKIGRSARVISSDEDSLDDQEDASKQRRKIADMDKDADDMAQQEINVAEKEVSTADPVTTVGEVVTTASVEVTTASPNATTTADDLTLAQTLIEIRSARPKAKGITFREPVESTTITTSTPISLKIKDKGKAKMIELDKPLKKKD